MTREEFDYLKDVVESISARFKNAKTDFYGSAEIIMYEDECKTLESAISALSAEREKTMKLSEVYKLLGADMRGKDR